MMFACLVSATISVKAVAEQNVTPISDIQRGSMVVVSGTVERITDEDEFRLADSTGSVRVYVGPNWVPASVGEAVTVSGFVDNGFGFTEIYARTMTREDGTIVTFEHRYD
ncbi:hypothetical protein CWE08_05630 [Aliidiomarina iranensis]|uniref:Bacterial OB-fold domain-containing protein n=2 Tax=Aliidiomarina iranensis TaxID=1434071 RepID=A0A432W0Z8_9GAMM|nr:hypothetical protein CWE08_05630 [Aliidiomarina iranensis]